MLIQSGLCSARAGEELSSGSSMLGQQACLPLEGTVSSMPDAPWDTTHPAQEKNRLFHAIDTIPAVTKKAEWALKWIQRRARGVAAQLQALQRGFLAPGMTWVLQWIHGQVGKGKRALYWIGGEQGLAAAAACSLHAVHSLRPPGSCWRAARGVLLGKFAALPLPACA